MIIRIIIIIIIRATITNAEVMIERNINQNSYLSVLQRVHFHEIKIRQILNKNQEAVVLYTIDEYNTQNVHKHKVLTFPLFHQDLFQQNSPL